jgi:DNA repair photolyase
MISADARAQSRFSVSVEARGTLQECAGFPHAPQPVRPICEHTFVERLDRPEGPARGAARKGGPHRHRWSSQDVKQDDAGRLPGVRDTVIRRFDAPEALDMRFHEIRTKSALNRVPEAARLPFEWTVNPYRGCSHACKYCLRGETPVLLADGRTRQIADLRPGDEIYGTVRRGSHRRYVKTEVLAHWATLKSAYRVTLEDGTELVASGDHRFLTGRGWKHVVNNERGVDRARLTLDDKLMGTGKFALGPREDTDYRRGYLCGIVRGDAHLASRAHVGSGGSISQQHAFRLALVDLEALDRAQSYLADLGLLTHELVFGPAAPGCREMRAIGSESRSVAERIRETVAWPWAPTSQWCKGFLAGIFDAEGGCTQGIWRVCSTDSAIIERTADCLRRLGFRHVVEDRCLPNHRRDVRLLGGAPEQARFFHTVDPAITCKRSLEGRAVKSQGRLGVASIEPLGLEMPMYDITTGTGDFVADGVISHNCFARPTHEYLDMGAGRDFEREIVVKVNVPEVLRVELARPSWTKERVALGTNTDPYQWVEARYKLMRGIWEAMRDFRNPCSILTKSPLVLRDLGLLKEIAAVTEVSACLSVPTLDEQAWRATEPHTPHPRARLEAVAELNRNGIPTGILIAPLMPGINDAREQVERIVAAATEANATYIGGNTLFLRGSVREIFFEWLREHRPDLRPRYERLYARGAHLPAGERRRIELDAGAPWALKSHPERLRHRGERQRLPLPAPPPPPAPVQGSLF